MAEFGSRQGGRIRPFMVLSYKGRGQVPLIISELLRTALLPTLCALAVGFLGGGLMGKSHRVKDIWMGLALAAGFSAGFLAIVGMVPFPAVQVTHWLLWFALGTWLVFAILGMAPSGAARWGGFLVFVLVALLLLKPFFDRWSTGQIVAYTSGISGYMFLLYLAIPKGTALRKSGPVFWIFIVAATGASMVHVLDGGALSGQLGGVLAAACGGLFLASCFGQGLQSGLVCSGVFVALFGSTLVHGHLYVEVFLIAILLVALAPFAVLWYRVPLFSQMAAWKRWVVSLVTAMIPVAIAIAWLISRVSEDPYGGY